MTTNAVIDEISDTHVGKISNPNGNTTQTTAINSEGDNNDK
jgi:hypothetical protein